jgi:mRNA interferase MazF
MPRRGEVYLVAFPFTDLSATKVRPALVVSAAPYHRATSDVLLAAISSVPSKGRPPPSDVVLLSTDPEFGACGLKRSSVILCGKLFTMEQRLVLRTLGSLGRHTMGRVDAALAASLGLGPWK